MCIRAYSSDTPYMYVEIVSRTQQHKVCYGKNGCYLYNRPDGNLILKVRCVKTRNRLFYGWMSWTSLKHHYNQQPVCLAHAPLYRCFNEGKQNYAEYVICR